MLTNILLSVLVVIELLYLIVGIQCYIPGKSITNIAPVSCNYRVAIHLTGAGRGNLNSIDKYLIRPLNADVFVDGPNIPDHPSIRLRLESLRASSNTRTMFNRMYNLQLAFDNYMQQHPSIKYDIVIRARPDLILRDYLTVETLASAAEGILNVFPKNHVKYIYNPYGRQLYTDTLFLSSPATMRQLNSSLNIPIADSAMGEIVLTNIIQSLHIQTRVVMKYEILLHQLQLSQYKFTSYLCGKLIAHWPS